MVGKAWDCFKESIIIKIKEYLDMACGILKGAYELQGVDPASSYLINGKIIQNYR